MKKQPFLWLLLALWVCLAAGCNPDPTPLSLLEQAEQQWTAQNISGYRLQVLVVNSTWHAQSHQMTVKDGAVTDTSASCTPAPTEGGKCTVRAYTAETYTIPGLFAQARAQLKGQYAEYIKVTYDPTYGYPSQISYNNPKIVDGDWTWRVTSFAAIK